MDKRQWFFFSEKRIPSKNRMLIIIWEDGVEYNQISSNRVRNKKGHTYIDGVEIKPVLWSYE